MPDEYKNLIGQIRLQARESLDPDYERFMTRAADAIAQLVDKSDKLANDFTDQYQRVEEAKAEIERIRSALIDADLALVDARDNLCSGEDDDRYWRWFNRHEQSAFNRISAAVETRLKSPKCPNCKDPGWQWGCGGVADKWCPQRPA